MEIGKWKLGNHESDESYESLRGVGELMIFEEMETPRDVEV